MWCIYNDFDDQHFFCTFGLSPPLLLSILFFLVDFLLVLDGDLFPTTSPPSLLCSSFPISACCCSNLFLAPSVKDKVNNQHV